MKLYILIMLVLVLLSACSTIRDEVCTTVDVWEEKDSSGINHIMVQQACVNTVDWNNGRIVR